MQVFATSTSDYASFNGFHSLVPPVVARSSRESRKDVPQRVASLLSAGIARAPAYETNWMLTNLLEQVGPALASGQIAEAVVNWLNTGHALPASTGSLQLGEKRGGHSMYETFTQATLRRDAWRQYPELRPIMVEGSPDAPHAKTARKPLAARRTHHFVMLRMDGRMYVIDAAHGMVFDTLGAYLETVTLPGHSGEASARMKWFRIVDGDFVTSTSC